MTALQTRYLTTAEVARLLRVTPDQVTRLARRGRIPHLRIEGAYRFPAAALEAWLQERTWTPAPKPLPLRRRKEERQDWREFLAPTTTKKTPVATNNRGHDP